jgi:glutamate N-acetyltransferase/amino-acid N-acetyltransferase
MAKGAGMIAPDMATMLSYVFTDAPISAAALQAMLSKSVQGSFNAITVDSDTSTSDTLMLFATGTAAKRGAPKIALATDRRLAAFKKALDAVLLDLAHQVVRDGEGCRKFVEIRVEGAASAAAAKRIALSIANSPLVKTAVAGEDANWGRIVAAVGKAGEKAERDGLAIWFGDIRVAHKGLRDNTYDEAKTSAYMKGEKIDITVDVGVGGKGVATFIGCLLGLYWPAAILFGLVWLAVAKVSRYSSLAALVASALAPLAFFVTGQGPQGLLAVVLAAMIFFTHRANIARLRAGSESRIGQQT